MPASKKSTILLTIPERARTDSPASSPADPDVAAARALEWLARGEPQNEIVYDESAPKQTPKELADFQKAGYRKVKPTSPDVRAIG